MSALDEKNENNNVGIDAQGTDSPSTPESAEEVKKINGLAEARIALERAHRGVDEAKAERDRLTREGEEEREQRKRAARERMKENSRKAQKLGEQRAQEAEYSGEYRKKLARKKSKKAEEELLKRAEEEKRLEEEKALERQREIEEFYRREREEFEKRGIKTDSTVTEASVEETAEVEPIAEAPVEETAEVEPSAEAPVEETAEVEPAAEAPAEETAEVEPAAEAPAEETAEVEPSAEAPAEETAEVVPTAEAPVEETAEVEPIAEAPAEEIAEVEPSAEAPVEETAEVEPTAEAPVEETAEVEAPAAEQTNETEESSDSVIRIGARIIGATPVGVRPITYRTSEEQTQEVNTTSTEPELTEEEEQLLLGYNSSDTAYGTEIYGVSDDSDSYDPAPTSVRSESDTDADIHEDYEHIDVHNRRELAKRIKEAHREEEALNKEITKIEKKQKKSSVDGAVILIVRKIALQKEVCEIIMDALHSCVYVGAKREIRKTRDWLCRAIDRYNLFADEYEKATGRHAPQLSHDIATDITLGIIPPPIQPVYLVSDDIDPVVDVATTEEALAPIQSEMEIGYEAEERNRLRREREAERERQYNEKVKKKETAKEFANKLSRVKYNSERDVALIKARFEHNISLLETRLSLKMNHFTVNDADRSREIREIESSLRRLNSGKARALKLEAADNTRYYQLTTLDPEKEKLSKKARRERLDSLKTRLEVLLGQREELNARLLSLYGGSEQAATGSAGAANRKSGKIQQKYAKYMYRRQRALARKVSRMHVTLDLKEKIFDLMNKKTEQVTLIESSRYKLRTMKLRGAAKREVKNTIKEAKRIIKSADADIKYLMQRAAKQDTGYQEDRKWIGWVVGVGIVVGIAVIAWVFAGEEIMNFVKGFFPG